MKFLQKRYWFCFISLLQLLFRNSYSLQSCTQLPLLPMPKNINCSLASESFLLPNPCSIAYLIQKSSEADKFKHFVQLIEHQQLKTFGCRNSHVLVGSLTQYKLQGFNYTVSVQVTDSSLKSAFTTKEEIYTMKVEKNHAVIKAPQYVGFVRALQSLMQLIVCNKKKQDCRLQNLPIEIEDEPAFSYRGLMVDTARHYQPIHLIYETIDALMYNKMSILHWHVVDQDSFPLQLKSHPELAEYGAFSPQEIYTIEDVKKIVQYALVRGVRVIPELDTPGHAASWSRAPQNERVACVFGGVGYMGPLDVTLSQTYTLVAEVFKQIFELFPDPIVHLGGDEVVLTCLTNKTQFMKAEQVDQVAIQLQYRKKQKKMLRQINPHKRFMYWMNSQVFLDDDDIVHWWGNALPDVDNQIVISNYGPFYIDMGVGNYFGFNYGNYVTWLDLYNQDLGKMISTFRNKQKVIGAQVTLWSQISNQYTHHTKIWIRTSSLAERSWNLNNYPAKPDFFRRITSHERLMNRRGIPTAPATCQQCEFRPQFC